MSLTIGYYIHHHGMGHLARALVIAEVMPGQITLLGTGLAGLCGDARHIELADDRMPADRPAGDSQPEDVPESLHYAPLGCEGIRRRAAAITGWIASHRPDLLVVDVSVEVAMLARLASTPVLYVRLAGARNDAGHQQAFRGARALLSPFHQSLDDPQTASWVREKTRYFPGLTSAMPARSPNPATVLVVFGAGGTSITGAEIVAAAAATPLLQWRVIGVPAIAEATGNLLCLGWIADAAAEIAAAGIVIGAAGDGVVNAVLAAGRPFICLPQDRPYDEQRAKARRLAALGAAIVLDAWPAGPRWPEMIQQAQNLSQAASGQLHDPRGVQNAADFIAELAASR